MHRSSLILALFCAAAQAETPVVVELFTSEGCSSCPPADALLAKLESTQPVAGARIIVLSEHVDYWDRLGWRDPFSSTQFTARQQEYSQIFRDSGPYTPEMVIDGATGFVGSESAQALRAIAQAARAPKATVRITTGAGKVSIQTEGVTHSADVLLAITERNLLSAVARGENAGRKLPHTAVVRWLRVVGKTRRSEPFTAEVNVSPEKSWKPGDLHAVVFLQDRSSRKMLGAAEAPLAVP
jgi:hypothetical protein